MPKVTQGHQGLGHYPFPNTRRFPLDIHPKEPNIGKACDSQVETKREALQRSVIELSE